MVAVPEDASELEAFILEDVFRGIELEPHETQSILSYMQGRHEHLFGPFTTYFVLGSYEPPFKYRLEIVLTELNNRLNTYAYLLAPQSDPELPDRLPKLKLKFYLHALYANWIPLVLEHNTGGALAEFGRADRPFLFDRTYVFPRGQTPDLEMDVASIDEVHALCIDVAYEADDEDGLTDALEDVIGRTEASGLSVTIDDLQDYLETELGGRVVPSISGVLTDGTKHYELVDRCFYWTTEADLRDKIDVLP